MKTLIAVRLLLASTFVLSTGAGSGCQSDKHTMVEARPGMTVVCQDCYNQAVKMRHFTGSGFGTGPRFGSSSYEQTHQVHQCSSCKTEMSTYVENGVTMIKCAGCAPSGVACDKCLPPGSYTAATR